MSWKDEFIKSYGKAAYEKTLVQSRAWEEANPEKREEIRKRQARKGGKYYEKHREYQHTGLQGERHKIRAKHGMAYLQYKRIIAPDSVLHHQWRLNSAEYDGVALVEKAQHQLGFVDVVQLLEGEITLLTEEEVRNRGGQIDD